MARLKQPARAVRSRVQSQGLWNALTAPGMLTLTLIFVVPMGLLAVMAFGRSDSSAVGRPTLAYGLTFDNFAMVFSSYNFPVLVRTVAYALIATVICIVVGYAVAYFAARFAGKFGAVLIGLVLLPWLVNYLVRIYAWRTITTEGGLINGFLIQLGIEPVQIFGTPFMVVLGLVYGYLPLMVLPIYAALGQLSDEIIDAGKDLYGGRFQTFWRVTLPVTREGVIGGVMLVFLPMLGDFATTQFLGGPSTTMVGTIIADQFISGGSQPFGAALTTVLVIGLILVILISRLAARRRTLAGRII